MVVGLVISTPAAFILSRVGIFLALILGPLAGAVIAEVVWWVIRRRHGRWMWLVVSLCIALGGFLSLILSAFFSPTSLLSLIIYTVLAIGTAYARLR